MNLTAQIKATGACFRASPPPKSKGRSGGVRGVSVKRALQKAEYARLLPIWRAKHPVCEVCPVIQAAGFKVVCLGATDHPHHVKGRRGELLCDTRYFKSCCGGESHPQWIHFTNKDDAIQLGLLVQPVTRPTSPR
jgi:hypothetical protein